MLVCIMLALLQIRATQSAFQNVRFQKSNDCRGMALAAVDRYQTIRARGIVECVNFCGLDSRCLSVVFDTSTLQCCLGAVKAYQNCSNMEPASKEEVHLELIKPCTNYGVSRIDERCACIAISDCQQLARDCTDGYKKGWFRESGVYTIHPALAPAPFQVHCSMMDSQVRTFVVRREERQLDFNRTWEEYQGGFGSLAADHWLGLDKLHLLTASQAYELRFRVRLENGSVYYQFYKDFVVRDQSAGYSFILGITDDIDKGLGDCLTPLMGASFSTYDNDSDGDNTTNCAQRYGAGWWFLGANCSSCNPLGPFTTLGTDTRLGVEAEAFWTHKMGDMVPFTLYGYLVLL